MDGVGQSYVRFVTTRTRSCRKNLVEKVESFSRYGRGSSVVGFAIVSIYWSMYTYIILVSSYLGNENEPRMTPDRKEGGFKEEEGNVRM